MNPTLVVAERNVLAPVLHIVPEEVDPHHVTALALPLAHPVALVLIGDVLPLPVVIDDAHRVVALNIVVAAMSEEAAAGQERGVIHVEGEIQRLRLLSKVMLMLSGIDCSGVEELGAAEAMKWIVSLDRRE